MIIWDYLVEIFAKATSDWKFVFEIALRVVLAVIIGGILENNNKIVCRICKCKIRYVNADTRKLFDGRGSSNSRSICNSILKSFY